MEFADDLQMLSPRKLDDKAFYQNQMAQMSEEKQQTLLALKKQIKLDLKALHGQKSITTAEFEIKNYDETEHAEQCDRDSKGS